MVSLKLEKKVNDLIIIQIGSKSIKGKVFSKFFGLFSFKIFTAGQIFKSLRSISRNFKRMVNEYKKKKNDRKIITDGVDFWHKI